MKPQLIIFLFTISIVSCGREFFADSTSLHTNTSTCGETARLPCKTIGQAVQVLLRRATPNVQVSLNLLGGQFTEEEHVVFEPHADNPILPSEIVIGPDSPSQPIDITISPAYSGGSFVFKNMTNLVRFNEITFRGYNRDFFSLKQNSRVSFFGVSVVNTSSIVVESGNFFISQTSFNGSGVMGNAITVKGSGASVEMLSSPVSNYNGAGSAIIVEDHASLKMESVKVNRVVATDSPIRVVNGATATLLECMFIQNFGGKNGGAIFIDSAEAELQNCTFRNNHAEGSGGGLYATSSTSLKIQDGNFEENSAENGGGFSVKDSTAKIIGTSINNNQADESGGGFFGTATTGSITLDSCSFSFNKAQKGTQISALEAGSRISLENIDLHGSSTDAIACEGSDVCHICESTCDLCDGACISSDSGDLCYLPKGFDCNGHGTCKIDELLGMECVCQDGFQGANCEIGNTDASKLLLAISIIIFIILLVVAVSAMIYLLHRYRNLTLESQRLIRRDSSPILSEAEKQ